MDEHLVCSEGRVAQLKHDIIDENHKGMTFWIDKHNRYADREMQDYLEDSAYSGPKAWFPALPYVAVVLALVASLLLFLSLKSELRRISIRQRKRSDRERKRVTRAATGI